MFMRKFKTGLRFLGTLFLRVLLGIAAGYVWITGLAFIGRLQWVTSPTTT